MPLTDDYDFRYLSFRDAVPYPEEDADDGEIFWYDLTGPPIHGFDRNLPPGERFVITTVFDIVGDFTTTVNTAVVSGAVDVHGNPAGRVEDSEIVINIPTGINLLYLRASARDTGVLVEWASLIEVDTYGFWLYRATVNQFAQASRLFFQPGRGSLSGAEYAYLDKDVIGEQRYVYWLVEVDNEGRQTLYGPVSATAVTLNAWQSQVYLPLILRRSDR